MEEKQEQNAGDQKEETKRKGKVYYSAIPAAWTGGPMNLGDPDDRTLRKVEESAYLPSMLRKKINKEKCSSFVEAFNQCTIDEGFSYVFFCRKAAQAMKDCQMEWALDKKLRDEVREEFLDIRSEYRRTGHGLTWKKEEAEKQKRMEEYRQKRLAEMRAQAQQQTETS